LIFLSVYGFDSIDEFLTSALITETVIVIIGNMKDEFILGPNQILGNACQLCNRYASLDYVLFNIVYVFSRNQKNPVLLEPTAGSELFNLVNDQKFLMGV